jgi:hypothetical protein
MVLGTVRAEAEPQERQLKAHKTKLTQGAPSGSSQLRSDFLMMARQEAVPHKRQPKALKGELENNSRKPRDLVGKLSQ